MDAVYDLPAALRRNRGLILLYEFLWGLGTPFLLINTMHVGYLDGLGCDTVVVGLATTLFAVGYAVTGPLSTHWLRGRCAFRWTVCCFLAAPAAMMLVGLSAMTFPPESAASVEAWRVGAYFAGLAVWTFGLGAGDPHYLAGALACAGPEGGSRFFARRWAMVGVGGVGGAYLCEWLRAAHSGPDAYPLGFTVGAALLMAGALPYALLFLPGAARSDPHLDDAPAASRPGAGLLSLLRHADFRRLLAAFLLFVAAQKVFNAFLSLALRDAAGPDIDPIGGLNRAFMFGVVIWAAFVGWVGGRFGHRWALLSACWLLAIGTAGASSLISHPAAFAEWLPPATWAWIWYFTASAWLPGGGITQSNLVAATVRDRPAAQAVAQFGLLLLPVQLAVPPLAGAAIQQWGYLPILVAGALAALAAPLALWTWSVGKRPLAPSNPKFEI